MTLSSTGPSPEELEKARRALSTNGGEGIKRHIFLCAEAPEG